MRQLIETVFFFHFLTSRTSPLGYFIPLSVNLQHDLRVKRYLTLALLMAVLWLYQCYSLLRCKSHPQPAPCADREPNFFEQMGLSPTASYE